MTAAIDILVSLILLSIGYIYICYYFNGVKEFSVSKEALKFTPKKILYLVFGAILAGVLIFLLDVFYSLGTLTQVKLLSLVLIIFPIAVVDLRVQKIPNKLLIMALIIRALIFAAEVIVSVPMAVTVLKDGLLGTVIIAVFFLVLLLVFRNSIGMGDIKLFAIMGLYQGLWGAITSVFFSLMVSFVFSVGLLITRKKGRKDVISFGPSILIGTVIAIALTGM